MREKNNYCPAWQEADLWDALICSNSWSGWWIHRCVWDMRGVCVWVVWVGYVCVFETAHCRLVHLTEWWLPGTQERVMGSYCTMVKHFSVARWKKFKGWMLVLVAKPCEWTRCNWKCTHKIVMLRIYTFMLYMFYQNKKNSAFYGIKMIPQAISESGVSRIKCFIAIELGQSPQGLHWSWLSPYRMRNSCRGLAGVSQQIVDPGCKWGISPGPCQPSCSCFCHPCPIRSSLSLPWQKHL